MIIQYFRSIVAVSSLVFISGCVGYVPQQGYSRYSNQPYSPIIPYGGYSGYNNGFNISGPAPAPRVYGGYRSNEREFGGGGFRRGENEWRGHMRGERGEHEHQEHER
ncbi:hypothetical protein [Methylomonas sp. AM2-LC]|uniref:hypothetical protein n=1 Tax=Methylomonas sp. AM2-LC TaxID=3153301 RepID=UPI0032649F0F